jgi:xanthine dehydrogenase accessory factor
VSPDATLAIMEAIEAALDGAAPVVVATVTDGGEAGIASGEKLLVRGDGSTLGALSEAALQAAVVEAAGEVFKAFPRVSVETLYLGRDGSAVTRRHQARPGDALVMLQLFESPARLVVVGAGHVGLAVAELGEMLGFGVTVVDDREEFANAERFPMAEQICCGEIDVELDALRIDQSAYVVLVSRGHKQDEIALRHVVGRGAAYVGMIGSKRRTATVLEHLMSEGFARADLEVVATPVGLDIGAETPAEIAVSILAEVTLVRRGGTGRRMFESRPALRAGAPLDGG